MEQQQQQRKPCDEDFPEVVHIQLPEALNTDLPEVAHSTLPEAIKEDFPETADGRDLPEAVRPGSLGGFIWKKHWFWIALAAIVVIGAAVGGAVGGVLAVKAKSSRQSSNFEPTSLAPTYSYPVPVSWSDYGRIDVYGRSSKNMLYRRVYENGTWDHPNQTTLPLPIALSAAGEPALRSRNLNVIEAFFATPDGRVYQHAFPTQTRVWGPNAIGTAMGGNISSAVECISTSGIIIDLFALDTDRRVTHRSWLGSTLGWLEWAPFAQTGGPARYVFTPSAVGMGNNLSAVFVVQENHQVVYTAFNPVTQDVTGAPKDDWVLWQNIGGRCFSRPSAAFAHPSRLDVFCSDADGKLAWATALDGRSWTGWRSVSDSPDTVRNEVHAIPYPSVDLVLQIVVLVQTRQNTAAMGILNLTSLEWNWQNLGGSLQGPPRATVKSGSFEAIEIFAYDATRSLKHLTYNITGSKTDWMDLGPSE